MARNIFEFIYNVASRWSFFSRYRYVAQCCRQTSTAAGTDVAAWIAMSMQLNGGGRAASRNVAWHVFDLTNSIQRTRLMNEKGKTTARTTTKQMQKN